MTGEIVIGTAVVVAVVVLLSAGLVLARRALIPEGAVAVRVNAGRALTARRGDALLSVLQRAGLVIPAACDGNGTCGLCRVAVEGPGAGTPQAVERGILSPAERRVHTRLACQVSLRGPVAVTLPEAVLAAETRTLTVRSNRMLAPLIRELVLDAPGGIAFRPDSFMQLHAPPYRLHLGTVDIAAPYRELWRVSRWTDLRVRSETAERRAYSIANRPQDAGSLAFLVRVAVPPAGRERDTPPGLVSSWLFALKPGDTVEASGPFGDFGIRDGAGDMIFVGGGVGMAPLRAMIHAALAEGASRRIHYFYGARSAADLFYSEEFDRLTAAHPDFAWTPALSDPAPGDR